MKYATTFQKILTLACTMTLLLAGCHVDIPAVTEENTELEAPSTLPVVASGEQTAAVDANLTCRKDNLYGAAALLSNATYPAANGDDFYVLSGEIEYYDFDQQYAFSACPLAGCQHKDDTCPAKIQDLQSFFAIGDSWYALCGDASDVTLLEIQPRNGQRTTICSWPGTDTESFYVSSSFYSAGRIFATLGVQPAPGEETVERDYVIICVELATGAVETLAQCDSYGTGYVVGASQRYAVLDWYTYTEPLLSMEAYLEQNPEGVEEDYYHYLNEFGGAHVSHSLRLYDLNTMTYIDVEGTEQAVLFTDPNSCYDNWFVYLDSGTIQLCDLETGEVKPLLTASDISNGWLMDGRLFYLSRDGADNENLQEYVVNLTTGETTLLHDYGQAASVPFSANGETTQAFIGLCQGKSAWIAKEDYYAGQFDRAVFF